MRDPLAHPDAFSKAVLDWYDTMARDLSWREKPGVTADPYRVWLAEIMLQQTTVAAVEPYFAKFTTRWPDVHALARADLDDVLGAWAGLGYYARGRNLHKCAKAVSGDLGGRFPDTVEGLLDLPGIGPYTAAAIASIAFERRAAVIDGNVERVLSRLLAITTPLPALKKELADPAHVLTPARRPGDYAQAMMDIGATVCTPRKPACMVCPVADFCAGRAQGIAETLPRRAPKKAKPVRFGAAFVLEDRHGGVYLQRRPEQGLLGGMLGTPGTAWEDIPPDADGVRAAAPVAGDWQARGEIRHTFTHFHLRLQVFHLAAEGTPPPGLIAVSRAQREDAAIPTVFAKVLRAAWTSG